VDPAQTGKASTGKVANLESACRIRAERASPFSRNAESNFCDNITTENTTAIQAHEQAPRPDKTINNSPLQDGPSIACASYY
jgi:hypothetical protein